MCMCVCENSMSGHVRSMTCVCVCEDVCVCVCVCVCVSVNVRAECVIQNDVYIFDSFIIQSIIHNRLLLSQLAVEMHALTWFAFCIRVYSKDTFIKTISKNRKFKKGTLLK